MSGPGPEMTTDHWLKTNNVVYKVKNVHFKMCDVKTRIGPVRSRRRGGAAWWGNDVWCPDEDRAGQVQDEGWRGVVKFFTSFFPHPAQQKNRYHLQTTTVEYRVAINNWHTNLRSEGNWKQRWVSKVITVFIFTESVNLTSVELTITSNVSKVKRQISRLKLVDFNKL